MGIKMRSIRTVRAGVPALVRALARALVRARVPALVRAFVRTFVLAPVLAVVAVSLVLAPARLQAATAVATAVAQAGSASGVLSLDGTLQAVRQATLSAQVGGNLVLLAVKPGDSVRAGQLVARVDERASQAGVLRSEAGLAQAEAEARNAQLIADHSRDLRNQGFVSQAALDQAENQLKAARAGVQQAQASRTQATLLRGFGSITAPFDGVVQDTQLQVGDLATPGRAIATVYAPGALRAMVQVPASMVAAARNAAQVQLQLADGQRIVPSSHNLLPTADPVSQTVEWRLELPAAPGGAAAVASGGAPAGTRSALLPGQTVRVIFSGQTGTRTGQPAAAAPLLLPQAAVLRRGELTAVFTVDPASPQRFVLRAVRTGSDRGPAGVEVLAGLRAGERYALDAVQAGLDGAVPAP